MKKILATLAFCTAFATQAWAAGLIVVEDLGGAPCDSLDPYKNLDATSDILIEQRDALYASAPGRPVDWIQVAGRYHRPAGGAPAAKYRRTVSRHLSQVLGVNLLVTNP